MVQKQNGGHFINHWNTEQTPTIGILNVFGIPAPTIWLVFDESRLPVELFAKACTGHLNAIQQFYF